MKKILQRTLFLLVIILISTVSDAQVKNTITGKVIDEKGVPLSGVSVIIEKNGQGTSTDRGGNFAIMAENNDILQFSFVARQTQLLTIVQGKSVYNITLLESNQELQNVVVTALGIKRETKALGYSVQSVSGAALQTVKGVDVGTSLTGRVAGLLVKNSTEFTAAPDIQIRGENPLLVIDGVPYGNMTLRDVPPDDIDNITILKGATSSALYGYRGASGTIMVTTKRGSRVKGLSVSINTSSMFSAGYLAIPESQSTYGRVVNTATNTYARSGDGAWGVPMDGRLVNQWDPISKTIKEMPYLPIGKNNFNNFLNQGFILNNNISVVQQGESGSFRTSATWIDNQGQYPNSKYDKITYTMGGDMKIGKFSLSSNMTYNKQNSPNIGFSGYTAYDPMYNMLVWAAPDYDVRQYKDYWLVKNETQNNSFTSTNNNPYFDRYERTHNLNRDIFNGTLALNYDFTPWLKATFRTGFDTYSDKQEVRISKGSFQGGGATAIIKSGSEVWGESAKGSFNTGLGRGYSINNDFILTANQSVGKFNLDGFVGGTIYYRQDEGMEAFTQSGLSIPAFYSLKASVNPATVNSRLSKQQVNSLFGRLAASWNNLIYAEGTLRNDWSSTLPKSTRSYLYPSVSTSFIASELLPKTDWLSLWKLRGSWTSSKTPADVYTINSVYSIANNSWGNLSSATLPTTIRGADVHPESASTFEVGTAASFFRNLLSVDVSYYNKRMYDFLRSTGISPASGYFNNYININEEISRKGWEVFTNITPVKTKNFKWDIGLNWSTYARYYTKLDTLFSSNKPWVKVGERADAYVLRNFQRDPQGNIIYSNGLPLYSSYDSKFGYSDPDWIWGANTSLRYKNWQFNIAVDGRSGGLAQTTTEMYMWIAGSHPNSLDPARALDAATPGSKNYVGQGVKVISGTATYDTYGNITSDDRKYAPNDVPVTYKSYVGRIHKGTAWGGVPSPLDAYSTTFFKIREMSLTYFFPSSIYSKIKAKGVSVSAVGQNVFLWAKQFKYSDPDGGVENFSDPSMRYLGFNIKVDF
ncbi:MAG: SusC/RagA family TonB-linked outer membrane protein [Ginsengibacter sp.]